MNLLRKAVLIILLLGSALSEKSSAQFFDTESQSRTKAGLRLAIGGSQLYGTVLQNPRTARAFSGGFYVRNKLSSKFNIQTEALFSYRGGRYNTNIDTGYSYVYDKIVLVYADLPVYLMFNPKGDQKHNFMLGAQISWLLRSSLFASVPANREYDPPTPEYSNLPLKDYDVMLGAGYLYSLENIGFMFNIRYGLIDINDDWNLARAEPRSQDTPKAINPAQNSEGFLRNIVIDLSVSF
jgi:hypothetical protein